MSDQPKPIGVRLSSSWLRRYPPLATFIVALLIMFLVMPSALNLPQANPSTVLEYAPVPPENEDPPPPIEGSLSSLSLGSSSTLSEGSSVDDLEIPPVAGGKGRKPITKRCVGTPPRQTEDPNAPPCVPFFEGDNGGATFQGVTKDEVNVLINQSAYTFVDEFGEEAPEDAPATGTYCDVDAEPDSNPDCAEQLSGVRDHQAVRIARYLSNYFNDRFQTYGRRVHFWVYYSSGTQSTSQRRADAQDNWETVKPFAVIDNGFFGGYNDVYAEALTRRFVSVYSNFTAQPNKLYRDNAPFLWTFWPDVEHWADQFSSYLCKKVLPFPVKHSGEPADNGKPRRYGLMSTNNSGFPGLQLFAKLVKQKITGGGCPGGVKANVVGEYYFPNVQYSEDTDPAAVTAARQNAAQMQADRVTTVLVLGGHETQTSRAAGDAGYMPEWVVAGDLINDMNENVRYHDQEVWSHAWMATNQLREDKTQNSPCRQANREAHPEGTNTEATIACILYRSYFMLFRAIQVAGPFLTPEAVDQGNHAIPRVSSNDPYTAACFYDPGDFTCVKDAHEAWWDPDAPDPDNDPGQQGCFRMVRGGKRYLAGTWEGTDADVFSNQSDPCNNVRGQVLSNLTGGL